MRTLVVLFLLAATNVFSANLYACYKMDGNVRDSCGNMSDLTSMYTVTYNTGMFGQSGGTHFNGTLGINQSASVLACWFKTNGEYSLISAANSTGTSGIDFIPNGISAQIRKSPLPFEYDTVTINQGWNHSVLYFNSFFGEVSNVSIYINGNKTTTFICEPEDISVFTLLGIYVDELRIYQGTISQAEIDALAEPPVAVSSQLRIQKRPFTLQQTQAFTLRGQVTSQNCFTPVIRNRALHLNIRR